MRPALDAMIAELAGSDPEDRMALLVDRARRLKPWPDRLSDCRDPAHRVQACQSPVYLVAEPAGEHVILFGDAPSEAPTVRGFVALLVEALDGAAIATFASLPDDLIERAKLPEILAPRRVHGLHGIVRHLKHAANGVACGPPFPTSSLPEP